jgi:hypothetical protein
MAGCGPAQIGNLSLHPEIIETRLQEALDIFI